MRSSWLGLACVAVASVAQAAPAVAPAAITKPDWVEKPTGAQIAHAYPRIAAGLAIIGRAKITCKVAALGVLRDCRIIEETPKGLGFGEGALSLTPYFRMSPKLVEGRPVDGASVTVPVNFSMNDPEPAPIASPIGSMPSRRAMELAGLAVDAIGVMDGFVEFGRERANDLVEDEMESVTEETRREAVAAFVRAVQIESPLVRDRIARAYAQAFTEAELEQLLAFHDGALGRKLRASKEAIGRAGSAALNDAGRRVKQEAHDQFCRSIDCGPQVVMSFDPPTQ